MVKSILVIEDDEEINRLLCRALDKQGYHAVPAYTGPQGLALFRRECFDMILLDLMLPYQSGDKLLAELRTFSSVPVLVISAKETTQMKVDLLRMGADDYMTKPFDLDEVFARIEANLRRSAPEGGATRPALAYKDIRLDNISKQVTVGGRALSLTATEFRILEMFLSQPQKVFSKANLYESIWNEEYTVDDNTLNVHISRLRQKLGRANENGEYIETLWGLGYRLAK